MVVISPYPPPADGIGEHTKALCRVWGETYDIHVLTQGRSGVETVSLGETSIQVWRVLSASRGEIRSCLATIRPAWAYTQYTISSYGTCLLGVHRAVRELIGSGVSMGIGYHEPSREPGALPIVGKLIYRRMLSSGGRAIVFSANGLVSLEGLGGWSVETVPHGTSTIEAEAGRVAEIRARIQKPFALAFGFIHPDKGTMHFVEAIAELQRRGHDIRGVVAGEVRERTGLFKIKERGDRKYLAGLKKRAEDLGADIEFIGRVPDDAVGSYIQAAHINVLPYVNGTQSGVASLISGAGRGAVASNLPGLREQFLESALYCSKGDSEALVDTLEQALTAGVMEELDESAALLRERCGYVQVAERIERIARGR
jgi:glycosyltransferase involved in cell wall biosynthesis